MTKTILVNHTKYYLLFHIFQISFIFSYIIWGPFDDYIENIGIKYGIIKGIFERSVAWIFTH